MRHSFGRCEVPRDPISIGAAVLGLVGVTGASSFVAGAVGYGLLIGASVGLNYAAQALQKRGQGPTANYSSGALNDPSIKYNERQAIPRKRIIYGTAQVGGALFFEAVKPPYLYQGFLICAEQITAFRKMWIGTNEVAFASIVPNQILTPIAVDGQPNYPGRVKVSFRLGTPDQTIDPLLAQDFPNLDPSFRQRGIATVVVRYDYGADYDEFQSLYGQVQKPNPLWLVDGIAIPDPRVPGHILDWNPDDPATLAAAKASWSFSNNASLIQAHYLTQKYGGRILPSRLDWVKTAEAADWDDGLVYCKDGTYQKRYTIDGVVTLNQSPSDVISGFIAANRGWVLQSAGTCWPSSSKPRTPKWTVHDGLLTGAVSIRAAKPKRDLINRVKTRCIMPDQEYQEGEGPTLDRPDLQVLDGEVLEGNLDLPFTLDQRRAQRLAKAYLENGRLGKQITCRVDVQFLANCDEDPIGTAGNFDSLLFSQGNGIYFCTDWTFADNFSSIDLSLTEYDGSIETDYDANVDEQDFVMADLDLS